MCLRQRENSEAVFRVQTFAVTRYRNTAANRGVNNDSIILTRENLAVHRAFRGCRVGAAQGKEPRIPVLRITTTQT